jgi:D-alanine-D-alanine ligase-like ATP-grasp enzyme
MEMLSVFGRENDSYRARVKGKTIHFSGLPRPEYMPKSAEWWIDDKSIVKEKLLQHGLPASVGGTYSNYHSLQRAFKQLQKPVILKPRLGSRGRHTTTHIHTEEQLKRAYAIAKQLCYWVVMEEHLFGSVFRATMIDAKLAGILRGDPPRITGDGIHTIAELITIKDSTRREGIKPVKISSETEHFIGRSGYTFESILPEGKNIELAHTIGVSYGGYSAEETHITHPEIVRLLELSAQVIGDPIIGFDFIIPDVSASPHTQRWGIIEANGVPFINLHHDPIDGTRNVAEKVWDFVEDNLQWY